MTSMEKEKRGKVYPVMGLARFFKIYMVSFGDKFSMKIGVNVKE